MKALYSVLSIIAFYLFYWISKSIFYSFLDETTTIGFVTNGEWYIAGAVAVIICIILGVISDDSDDGLGPGIFVIILATITAPYLPFSIGFVVLYNLIVIGCILWTIWDIR